MPRYIFLLILILDWSSLGAVESRNMLVSGDLKPGCVVNGAGLLKVSDISVVHQPFDRALRIGRVKPKVREVEKPVVVDLPFKDDIHVGDKIQIQYAFRCPDVSQEKKQNVFISLGSKYSEWFFIFNKERSLSSAWIVKDFQIVCNHEFSKANILLSFEFAPVEVAFELAHVKVHRIGNLKGEKKSNSKPRPSKNIVTTQPP